MRSGNAPGRLDLLGGVADYSGALVLEIATRLTTTVTAEPDDAFVAGSVWLSGDELRQLTSLPYPDVRAALSGLPKSAHYLIGVALVLVRHGIIDVPLVRLTVSSDVPQSVGVSSSAALEVATARALGADIDPLRLAVLCQEAENEVVGAPCGIMDQVTASVGTPDTILPILCRPASVRPAVALPPGVDVVGWPTGTQHDVSGSSYRRARVAAFMGKQIVEAAARRTWNWISELPPDLVGDLPEVLPGWAFLDRCGEIVDPLTVVDPDESYPVRAATRFGVEEHARSQLAMALLAARDIAAVGALLDASHAGYDAMGLGHAAATAVADEARRRPGVYGARSSGGGSGGTVVILCDEKALDDVDGLIR
jgi:galactokinase